jgi:hypothetical protein
MSLILTKILKVNIEFDTIMSYIDDDNIDRLFNDFNYLVNDLNNRGFDITEHDEEVMHTSLHFNIETDDSFDYLEFVLNYDYDNLILIDSSSNLEFVKEVFAFLKDNKFLTKDSIERGISEFNKLSNNLINT